MKKLFPLMFVVLMLVWSCGNKQPKTEAAGETEEVENALEKEAEFSPTGKAKDCDEFVDQYEKWMDNYLVLMEKYMKNPMDQEMLQQFAKVQTEAMEWISQWQGAMVLCANDEKYEKRFNEISEKAEKKMKELGLE
ncbi:MAG: DUF6591 domain-containing protein [Draconibacterium sp.]